MIVTIQITIRDEIKELEALVEELLKRYDGRIKVERTG